VTKTDRTRTRFLTHCHNRQRILDELAAIHRRIAADTDREAVLMADLDHVNQAIDAILEQGKAR
jgi:GGDEF domain-containing protein